MANANGWGDGASNNNIGWGKGADNAIGWGDIHADSYAGLTDIVGAVAFTGLLDTYSGAAVAYSLRQLSSAYSGNCIRVRRSVDNAEQDFGFVSNDLDTASMLDFVGYNRWTYSEQFNNALYVKTNINTTGTPAYVDVETAPDSTLTGDKIIENATSGSNLFRRETGTITNGNSYNISVYLKQGERTSVEIASQISGTLQTCILDLTNGNTSSNGFANTPVVTLETNGWYRFSVTITSGVTSQLTGLRVSLRNASNATSYLGDGTSGAYVWGTQLSQTSTVKTYQKTVATAGGNGFVTTWYDQSGNANNITRAVATQQPKIVDSGSVFTKGLKPCLDFDGADDQLALNSALATIATGNQFSIFNVHSSDLSNAIRTLWGNSTSGSNNQIRGFADTRTSSPLNWFLSNSSSTGFSSTLSTVRNNTDQRLQVSVMDSGNVMKGFDNGATGGTATYTGTYANGNLGIGNGANGALNGTVQEFIIFDTNQLPNRTAIESNINTFYTIY